MEIERYLKERVEDQLHYYENAANKAKNKHISMQTTIIVLGLLIPVVINLPNQWGILGDSKGYITGIVTIFSLSLAILTGISNFRKYGDLWLTYRMTEELIKHEKFLFLTSSGAYYQSEKAANDFVQTIESIISSEHNKFRSIIEESKRPTATKDVFQKA
ncbi:DUF4231 domain-containing protein [Thermodesulfobacteriota bacterium]